MVLKELYVVVHLWFISLILRRSMYYVFLHTKRIGLEERKISRLFFFFRAMHKEKVFNGVSHHWGKKIQE